MSEREMFWGWAKKENPKLIDEAETGCQFAKDILDYMFMGWVGSANREGYKLVPVDSLNKILAISDTIDNVLCGINEDDNIQSLLISIDDEVNAMIGVCDE